MAPPSTSAHPKSGGDAGITELADRVIRSFSDFITPRGTRDEQIISCCKSDSKRETLTENILDKSLPMIRVSFWSPNCTYEVTK